MRAIASAPRKSANNGLNVEQLRARDKGMETALIEWWLSDFDFITKYRQYEAWVSVLEDCMEQDYIFFYGCMCDGMYSNPVERDCKLQEIEERHEDIEADIEYTANELGL